jgi:hypothetical protein|tara:strand:- start:236 stop:415 length:180 start_codon:yes stop_codon:yes gene_type:complete
MIVINYLVIGVVFTLLVEMASNYTKVKFENIERFILIFIWPWVIINFIWMVVTGQYRKK